MHVVRALGWVPMPKAQLEDSSPEGLRARATLPWRWPAQWGRFKMQRAGGASF